MSIVESVHVGQHQKCSENVKSLPCCVICIVHMCVYLRGLPPPGNLFLVPGRSPKSCIIQTRNVENDMLCLRAVGRIPHCLASATNILFSAISHGVRTDGELLVDDFVDDLLTFVVILSSKYTSSDTSISSSPSAGVQSKSPYNQNKFLSTTTTNVVTRKSLYGAWNHVQN